MVVRPSDLPIYVSCDDAVGRRRQVVVAVQGRSVLLRVPPGETAAFPPALADELALLRRALVAAEAAAATSSR